jgi:hypothetical protein
VRASSKTLAYSSTDVRVLGGGTVWWLMVNVRFRSVYRGVANQCDRDVSHEDIGNCCYPKEQSTQRGQWLTICESGVLSATRDAIPVAQELLPQGIGGLSYLIALC